jgi:flagellar biosynthesis/type III secretory pathway M-ring protein FliF/YscJ
VFNIWGPFIETSQVHKLRQDWKSWLMMWFLWMITVVLRFVNSPKDQAMNTLYGNGQEIPREDIQAVSDAIWKNNSVYKWEKGDVIAIDNNMVAHGRLPFQGKRLVLTAFG